MRRNRAGFTLVEMIVVLAIIVILAGALVLSLTGYVGKASRTACLSNAQQVRRCYMASAAYLRYEVTDTLPVLTEAAEACGGTEVAADSYRAACGGTCRVVYSADKTQILKITCSKHGELFNYAAKTSYSDPELVSELAAAVNAAGSGNTENITNLYSGVNSSLMTSLTAALPENVRTSLQGKTWRIAGTNKQFTSYTIYIYDGSLEGHAVNSSVSVDAYDASGRLIGKKTAYVQTYRGHLILGYIS